MSVIAVERTVECKSDVCSLWNALADTERMNRAVGLDRVDFEPLEGAGAARFLASTNLGGFDVQYEERPFEWQYLKRFAVERIMRGGPAARVVFGVGFEVLPNDAGTRVRIHTEVTPRIGLLTPIIRLSAGRSMRKFEDEVRRIDFSLRARGRPPKQVPAGAVDEEALSRIATALKDGADPELVDKLVAVVAEASDVDASRIRPFALADEWKRDRTEVLTLLLRGVKEGLVELRWEMVCPSCRTATASVPTLGELKDHGACQLCEIDFDLAMDEALEATFAPRPTIRDVDVGPYCIGGPARVPHVFSQAVLPSKGAVELAVPDEADAKFRLFLRGGKASNLLTKADAEKTLRVRASALVEKHDFEIAPGGTVVVENDAGGEIHAKIERSEWVRQAATAREVTALPAFRRDFSGDLLVPGQSLKVSRIGIFFSDLTGSTQLYSDVGDAAAFRLVQDHFDVVFAILEKHRGTLVKTIGDAVMAVFADELDGVAASMAILREFETFRRTNDTRERTHIKLGLHDGPCYVVTANGVLDYFGQTVNVAARLQAQADSGELVISEALAARAIERGLFTEGDVVERFVPKLKGVSTGLTVVRVRASRAE